MKKIILKMMEGTMNDRLEIDMNEYLELKKWAKYGHVMAGFIHNLNTPLMGISGRVEIMEIKYPDVKGLDLLTKHVDTITKMLQNTAFFTDKDSNNKEYDTDLLEFINRLDMFMKSHMKYKHHINVELNPVSFRKVINVQSLFNLSYHIINYLLEISEQEDTLQINNLDNQLSLLFLKSEENGSITDHEDIQNHLFAIHSELKSKISDFKVRVSDTEIEIQILI